MSMFLPESGPGAPQTDSVGSLLTPATLDISSGDIALMQKVLSAASRNPNLIPSDFMAYIVDYIQTSRLSIPIGQVFGFTQFTPQVASSVTAQENTSSSTYVDLATAGPQLTSIPDGQYLIVFGAGMLGVSSTGPSAFISVSINGSTPLDADGTSFPMNTGSWFGMIWPTTKTLKNSGSNTIKMQYKVDAGATAAFRERWLFVIKFANV